MFSTVIITLSDSASKKEAKDLTTDAVASILPENFHVVEKILLSDDRKPLEETLTSLCDQGKADLILTTGGTGFGPRDNTPEATKAVIEREVPGIPMAMMKASLEITDRAFLSRGTAGIRKSTLIINLPGSPKAATENLQSILNALPHGLKLLRNEVENCGEVSR